MKIKLRTTFNRASIKARIKAANKEALKVVSYCEFLKGMDLYI